MGSPFTQRVPAFLCNRLSVVAPILMVENRQLRCAKNALTAVVETGTQHRVTRLHALDRRFQALRIDALAIELQPCVATDIAQHFGGPAPQPVRLLHRAEFKTVVGCAQWGDISHHHRSHRLAMQQAEPGRKAGCGAVLSEVDPQPVAAHALLQVHQADGIQPAAQEVFLIAQAVDFFHGSAQQLGKVFDQPSAQCGGVCCCQLAHEKLPVTRLDKVPGSPRWKPFSIGTLSQAVFQKALRALDKQAFSFDSETPCRDQRISLGDTP